MSAESLGESGMVLPNFRSLKFIEGEPVPQPISDVHRNLLWHGIDRGLAYLAQSVFVDCGVAFLLKAQPDLTLDQRRTKSKLTMGDLIADRLLVDAPENEGFPRIKRSRYQRLSGFGLLVVIDSSQKVIEYSGPKNTSLDRQARRVNSLALETLSTLLERGMIPQPEQIPHI